MTCHRFWNYIESCDGTDLTVAILAISGTFFFGIIGIIAVSKDPKCVDTVQHFRSNAFSRNECSAGATMEVKDNVVICRCAK